LAFVDDKMGIPGSAFQEVDRLKLADELISSPHGRFGFLGREVN
jgi:hypothetical protein